jgi:hypothetical protein
LDVSSSFVNTNGEQKVKSCGERFAEMRRSESYERKERAAVYIFVCATVGKSETNKSATFFKLDTLHSPYVKTADYKGAGTTTLTMSAAHKGLTEPHPGRCEGGKRWSLTNQNTCCLLVAKFA